MRNPPFAREGRTEEGGGSQHSAHADGTNLLGGRLQNDVRGVENADELEGKWVVGMREACNTANPAKLVGAPQTP